VQQQPSAVKQQQEAHAQKADLSGSGSMQGGACISGSQQAEANNPAQPVCHSDSQQQGQNQAMPGKAVIPDA